MLPSLQPALTPAIKHRSPPYLAIAQFDSRVSFCNMTLRVLRLETHCYQARYRTARLVHLELQLPHRYHLGTRSPAVFPTRIFSCTHDNSQAALGIKRTKASYHVLAWLVCFSALCKTVIGEHCVGLVPIFHHLSLCSRSQWAQPANFDCKLQGTLTPTSGVSDIPGSWARRWCDLQTQQHLGR